VWLAKERREEERRRREAQKRDRRKSENHTALNCLPNASSSCLTPSLAHAPPLLSHRALCLSIASRESLGVLASTCVTCACDRQNRQSSRNWLGVVSAPLVLWARPLAQASAPRPLAPSLLARPSAPRHSAHHHRWLALEHPPLAVRRAPSVPRHSVRHRALPVLPLLAAPSPPRSAPSLPRAPRSVHLELLALHSAHLELLALRSALLELQALHSVPRELLARRRPSRRSVSRLVRQPLVRSAPRVARLELQASMALRLQRLLLVCWMLESRLSRTCSIDCID